MTQHWKNYAPIERVIAFNDGIAQSALVRVTANVTRYETPIRISMCFGEGDAPLMALTLAQSVELRQLLERAEADVLAGSDLDEEHVDG